MKKILTLIFATLVFLNATYSKPHTDEPIRILSDEFIQQTNKLTNGQWIAERTFHPHTSKEYLTKLMGVLKTDKKNPYFANHASYNEEDFKDLPKTFDARKHWPQCPSIGTIKDQSGCGSCWAVGATTAMSDRLCIHSPNNSVKEEVSSEDLLTCCDNFWDGCSGGYLMAAWTYWYQSGLVSGGTYGSHEGCQPYEFKPCEHHVNGTRGPCNLIRDTPSCKNECEDSYNRSYKEDKTFGKSPYYPFGGTNGYGLMEEILQNGPIECSFDVYPDFLNYRGGVYEHVDTEESIGGHAVKVLGWGEEHGKPYWLVANSWNTDWGDKGFFKMLRGSNVGIEDNCVAALPDFLREKGGKGTSTTEDIVVKVKSRSFGEVFQTFIDRVTSRMDLFRKWIGSFI